MFTVGTELTHRAKAMLRAVAAHRAIMTNSSEPDLFIDGFACCDQSAARELAHRGYIRPGAIALAGQRVPAEITAAGQAALTQTTAAA